MTEYNAIGVVDIAPTQRRMEGWVDALVGYHPAVSPIPGHRAEIVITLDAPFLDVAAATALQLLTRATGQLYSFEVLPTDEFDRRTDAMEQPDTVDTRTAAELLGVSRQRIQQLHAAGQLPGRKIGNSLALDLRAVRAMAADRDGSMPAGQFGPTADYGDDNAKE